MMYHLIQDDLWQIRLNECSWRFLFVFPLLCWELHLGSMKNDESNLVTAFVCIILYYTHTHFLLYDRLNCHFDLNKFRAYERKKVLISLTWVFAFMAIGWPLIIYKTGVIGWFKFWLMPWLGYHFWVNFSSLIFVINSIQMGMFVLWVSTGYVVYLIYCFWNCTRIR